MTREEMREKVAVCIMDLTIENKTPGQIADAAIALVLEEAARVADGIKANIYDDDLIEHGRLQACKEIAAAIRALKGKQ